MAAAASSSSSSPSSAPFSTLLSRRRILLVRHGNTGKAEVDADRRLTDKGKGQCAAFQEHYSAKLQSVANCVCSPVTRTWETAELLFAQRDDIAVAPIEELYFGRPGFRSDVMVAAEKKLGYAPVSAYLRECPGVYEAGALEMASALARAADGFAEGDVLVVSHAVYISHLALALIDALSLPHPEEEEEEGGGRRAWRAAARDAVLPVNVGEVCCFELSSDGVRYLPNPTATDFASASSNDAFVTGGGKS